MISLPKLASFSNNQYKWGSHTLWNTSAFATRDTIAVVKGYSAWTKELHGVDLRSNRKNKLKLEKNHNIRRYIFLKYLSTRNSNRNAQVPSTDRANNRMTMEWERANLSLKPGSDTKANVITVSEKNTTMQCLSAPADTAYSKTLTIPLTRWPEGRASSCPNL